jgi:urate oxidase
MSLKIGASSFGESRLRMLRVVRRGDRHDPRDLTVSCRFEGDFAPAFRDGRADGVVPGEALKNMVHAAAREFGSSEIEEFGIALCQRVLAGNPRITRARVELSERPWARLDAGGRAQGQAFLAGNPERRTAAVTSNGDRVAVVSGLEEHTLMRTSGISVGRTLQPIEDGVSVGLQRFLGGTLTARWTYNTPDVTFGPFRQGVRAAIIETFAWHGGRSVQQTLYAIADVVLASYQEISVVTLTMHERPYRPADLFAAGMENPDDLFVALDEPVGVVEVTVERESEAARSE